MKPTLGFGDELAKADRKERLRQYKRQAKAKYKEKLLQNKEQAFEDKLQKKLELDIKKKNDAIVDLENKYEEKQLKKTYGYIFNKAEERIEKRLKTYRAENELRAELGLKPLARPSDLKKRESFSDIIGGVGKGLRGSLKGIAKSMPRQVMPVVRRPRPEKPQRPNKLHNFFAHTSPEEAYGDDFSTHDGEMITFFDSEKREDDDTGAMFGL